MKSHYAKLDTSSNFNNVFKLFFITVKKMFPPILFPTQIVLGTKCTKRICYTKIILIQIVPDINCSQYYFCMNHLVQYNCHLQNLYHLYNWPVRKPFTGIVTVVFISDLSHCKLLSLFFLLINCPILTIQLQWLNTIHSKNRTTYSFFSEIVDMIFYMLNLRANTCIWKFGKFLSII